MPEIARDLYPDEAAIPSGDPSPASTGSRFRVLLWDERLSSWEAERLVLPEASGRNRRPRARPALDAHAAAVILQSFLDDRDRAPGAAPA